MLNIINKIIPFSMVFLLWGTSCSFIVENEIQKNQVTSRCERQFVSISKEYTDDSCIFFSGEKISLSLTNVVTSDLEIKLFNEGTLLTTVSPIIKNNLITMYVPKLALFPGAKIRFLVRDVTTQKDIALFSGNLGKIISTVKTSGRVELQFLISKDLKPQKSSIINLPPLPVGFQIPYQKISPDDRYSVIGYMGTDNAGAFSLLPADSVQDLYIVDLIAGKLIYTIQNTNGINKASFLYDKEFPEGSSILSPVKDGDSWKIANIYPKNLSIFYLDFNNKLNFISPPLLSSYGLSYVVADMDDLVKLSAGDVQTVTTDATIYIGKRDSDEEKIEFSCQTQNNSSDIFHFPATVYYGHNKNEETIYILCGEANKNTIFDYRNEFIGSSNFYSVDGTSLVLESTNIENKNYNSVPLFFNEKDNGSDYTFSAPSFFLKSNLERRVIWIFYNSKTGQWEENSFPVEPYLKSTNVIFSKILSTCSIISYFPGYLLDSMTLDKDNIFITDICNYSSTENVSSLAYLLNDIQILSDSNNDINVSLIGTESNLFLSNVTFPAISISEIFSTGNFTLISSQ